MSSMPVVEPMTAEEYLARPYDERERGWELIGGEIVDMLDPLLAHELVCREIDHALELWTRAQPGRGVAIRSIDVGIGPHDVYGPDVHWYREDRVPPRDSGRPYPVPDLAVDTAADEVLVFRRSRAGAPAFDVALELTRDDALTSPLLLGFAVPVATIFAG